jgi:chaperone required for assembly of F1-ATPase
MRSTVAATLAAFVLAMPIAAQQTQGQPAKQDAKVEKLWKIETSGIGG